MVSGVSGLVFLYYEVILSGLLIIGGFMERFAVLGVLNVFGVLRYTE